MAGGDTAGGRDHRLSSERAGNVNPALTKPIRSESEIRALISANRFTYQNVPLPYGLETGGRDRSETARHILPADMAGKSLIDVGCMYGYFCFAAEERGATRTVGVDVDPENVRKSRLLAECRGSQAEFHQLDIETQPIDGQFDYVLCLNVLHHMRNPLSALERLIAATREVLVLEVASFTTRDRRKSGVPLALASVLKRLPLMYVGGSKGGDAKQTFFITKSGLDTILLRHRRSFAAVDYIDSGHKGRYIAIARKRRINHLFVVAGVPAGGKTTLIERLKSGQDRALADRLGFAPERQWLDFKDDDIDGIGHAGAPDVILHYNILKSQIDGDLYLHDRALRDLVEVSNRVTLVTTWCPLDELVERYREGRTGTLAKRTTSSRFRKKVKTILDLYERPDAMAALFRDWFAFCRRLGAGPVVITGSGEQRVMSIDEFERSETVFVENKAVT